MKSLAFIIILSALIVHHRSSAIEVTMLFWADRHANNHARFETVGDDTTRIGGAAHLAGLVKSICTVKPRPLVFVAGGEFTGTPMSSLSRGLSEVKILNRIGIDAFLPGVTEFDHGWQSLTGVMKKANFPVLLSNVNLGETGATLFPEQELIDYQGILIAVGGMIAADFTESVIRDGIIGLKTESPVDAARAFTAAWKDSADLIVLLTHQGWEADSAMCAEVEGIDLVIGGRTSAAVMPPRKVGGALITSAGRQGDAIGRITIEVDTAGISYHRAELIAVDPAVIKPDKAVGRLARKLDRKYTRKLDNQIGVLQTDWNIRFDAPSNLAQFATDALHAELPRADLAVVHNGCLLKGHRRGPITERDLWQVCPLEFPIVVFQLNGLQLRRIVQRQLQGQGEFITWSGLNVTATQGKIESLLVKGSPISELDDYSVLTTGFVWDHLGRLLGLDRDQQPDWKLPGGNFREILIDAVKARRVISTPLDDRWDVK